MNEAQTNAALKAVSQSIISLRRRLTGVTNDEVRDQLQAELDLLMEARQELEAV